MRTLILRLSSPSPRKADSYSTSSSPASSQSFHSHDSKSVKVAVWWDIENCCIPNGVSAFRVPHRIISALRSHGIRGPISITAFGDITRLSRSTQDGLCASGVCLNHVPNCQLSFPAPNWLDFIKILLFKSQF